MTGNYRKVRKLYKSPEFLIKPLRAVRMSTAVGTIAVGVPMSTAGMLEVRSNPQRGHNAGGMGGGWQILAHTFGT